MTWEFFKSFKLFFSFILVALVNELFAKPMIDNFEDETGFKLEQFKLVRILNIYFKIVSYSRKNKENISLYCWNPDSGFFLKLIKKDETH